MTSRLDNLTKRLMNDTLLAHWFEPVQKALEKVRFSEASFRVLSMPLHILQSCMRQLNDDANLRAHIQNLFHLDPEAVIAPLARSTCADALANKTRCDILKQVTKNLATMASDTLPDRLANIPGLGDRAVYAMDGMYQDESAHFCKLTPSQGGADSAKGHLHLTTFDLRQGIPIHVDVDLSSISEIRFVKEHWSGRDLTCTKESLWVVDRGFIDAPYWDQRQRDHKVTMITRLKVNLNYTVIDHRKVTVSNKKWGIKSDQVIQLDSSSERWRLVGYQSDSGIYYEYLTNEMTLTSSVIAYLYHRRWDEEKYFDNYKNDLVGKKAWGKSRTAIAQQAMIGIITFILTRCFSDQQAKQFKLDTNGNTQQRKHRIKKEHFLDGKTHDAFRAYHTQLSKITRQVWRFLKHCLLYKHDQKLYERQLKPMMTQYL